MKILSRLRVVTITDAREEYETDCTVEFTDGGAELDYSADDGAFNVKMSENSAVVTRTGNNGYVLNLAKGEHTEFNSPVGTLKLFTKEMLFKCDSDTVKFTVRYAFDGGDDIRIILRTVKRGNEI